MYLINLIVALESPKPLINTLLATTDDHAVGALVRAGLITLGRRAPRAHRMTTALGAAFAAAVRMVGRVHRRAAHRRADAAPALRAGLAERTQIVLIVADLADYCAAFRVDLAGLARAESQRRVRTFYRHELPAGAGAARELGAAARLHLDAVDRGADGDVAQRQAVAGLDRRIARADQLRTGLDAFGRDNITAFAIGVYQQCDMGAAVRIVFQTLDHAGDADLVTTEIDDAIMLLVTATLMTHGDAAEVIAAAVFLVSLVLCFVWFVFVLVWFFFFVFFV